MPVQQVPTQCPYCGRENDMASEIGGRSESPETGDLSICIKCSEVSVFVVDGIRLLRKPTDVEALQIALDDKIQYARLLVQRLDQ